MKTFEDSIQDTRSAKKHTAIQWFWSGHTSGNQKTSVDLKFDVIFKGQWSRTITELEHVINYNYKDHRR